MTMHQSELVKQHQHYAAVRARLSGKPAKAIEPPKPEVEDDASETWRKQVDRLSREVRFLRDCLKHASAADERVKELELDLADARARILAQAELLKVQDASEDEEPEIEAVVRRPVHDIVADVLRDYPGVTWEDIKGVRRTRNLIQPRHACIRAVFDERKDLSSVTIGKLFGNRDHSTILNSVKKAAE